MSEDNLVVRQTALEERSRALFQDSVERIPVLTSAATVAAAMVLGLSLWLHAPAVHHGATPADASNFEDLDIVASSDNSQDNVEMLQDDLDFYAWAEKTAGGEPAA
jgi:hypothetical protein